MGMELVVLLVVELEVVLWRVCRWEGWGWEAVGWVSVLGEGEEIIAIALFWVNIIFDESVIDLGTLIIGRFCCLCMSLHILKMSSGFSIPLLRNSHMLCEIKQKFLSVHGMKGKRLVVVG